MRENGFKDAGKAKAASIPLSSLIFIQVTLPKHRAFC